MNKLEVDQSELEEPPDEEHPNINAVQSYESLNSVGIHSGQVKCIVDP